MNKADLEKIKMARERVVAAVGSARWEEVITSLADMLWSLAEGRPDFEELPTWIAEAQKTGVFSEHPAQAIMAAKQVQSILRSVVDRYGDANDRRSLAKMQMDPCSDLSAGELAISASDFVVSTGRLRSGARRLPLALHNDALQIGRHTKVSFHRTLRIPEDGRTYPLPAGFGRLPILRVEDYAERVPAKWLEQGGFIIPLYQREALFLEFAGVKWRPTIAKVSVGRVNAISGKEHDLKIRSHRQDYVVIPDQRWLDGINSGDGSVSQFVAMPLGMGYTIEAQVTDEEKHGGFQLAVFSPRRGRFPDFDPKQVDLATTARAERARLAEQHEVLRTLPDLEATVIRELQTRHYCAVARSLGISEASIFAILTELYAIDNLRGLIKSIPDENLAKPKLDGFLESRGSLSFQPRVEMGIAAGGRIKQQIFEDTYGADSWDESVARDVVIHIVNSKAYQRITGCPAPPSPITSEQYARCKIPWYSAYDEKDLSVKPVGVFKRIFSIGKIDKGRGIAEEALPKHAVSPEQIVRIRTQTLEERWKALVERAKQSLANGNHHIARREASLALDLFDKDPLPFFIRAISNHRLGHYSDAEADASACLTLQPNHMGALSVRAYSSLALGETLLAKNDAEMILASQFDNHDALYVRAEANLRLAHYDDAIGDAERMLQSDPADPAALRIREQALTSLSQNPSR